MIGCVDGCLDKIHDPCAVRNIDRERATVALATEGSGLDGDCYRGYWGRPDMGSQLWRLKNAASTNDALDLGRAYARAALADTGATNVTTEYRDGAVCVSAEVANVGIDIVACRRRCV